MFTPVEELKVGDAAATPEEVAAVCCRLRAGLNEESSEVAEMENLRDALRMEGGAR